MTQTLEDIRSAIGGGFSLLPAGTRNFEVTGATPVVREYDQARVLRLRLNSSDGGGTHEIPLAPWALDEKSLAQWRKIIVSWADCLGLDISDLDGTTEHVFGAISDRLTQRAQTLLGAVVEISVQHADYQKNDGSIGTRVKAYSNSLVRAAPRAAAPTGNVADLQQDLAPLLADGEGWSTQHDNVPF